jgi:hypothetical protein
MQWTRSIWSWTTLFCTFLHFFAPPLGPRAGKGGKPIPILEAGCFCHKTLPISLPGRRKSLIEVPKLYRFFTKILFARVKGGHEYDRGRLDQQTAGERRALSFESGAHAT